MRRALACVALVLLGAAPAVAAQDAFAKARQLRLAGRSDQALSVVQDALAREPGNEDLLGFRGMLLLDVGRTEDAARLADELGGYAGESFRVYAFLGRQRLVAGDPEASVDACRRALQRKPDAVEASVCLVQALLSVRRARPAVRAAESLEQISPEWGRRLGAQALLLQAQKMRAAGEESLPRALPVLRAALEKDPGSRPVQETLVETLIDTARVEEARRLIEAHFAGEQDGALRHYLLGRGLDVMTDVEGARREYLAAVEVDPACTNALLELARIAIEEEAYDQAGTWLDRVVTDGPGASRQLLLRGLMEDGRGHPDAARRAYEQALAVAPENGKARYLLGRLLVREGEVDQGQALLASQAADEDL